MNCVVRSVSAFLAAGVLLLAGCPAPLLDDYEPNDTIAEASVLGTVAESPSVSSWTATISPKGDCDWYRFTAPDPDSPCVPLTAERFTLTVRMVPPQAPEVQNYDLSLYNEAGTLLDSSTNPGADEELIVFTWDGVCGSSDSREFFVVVNGVGGAASASPYTLFADLEEASR
jgi:hypothetical protein